MTKKIVIFTLSVKYSKMIFDCNIFNVIEFKEDETAEHFDMELAEIDAISLHDNGVTIIGIDNELFIPRNEFKEIKIK